MTMNMITKCACLTLISILSAGVGLAQTSFNVGDKAPDFELTDATGKTYKLSDFQGEKLVVLEFFRSGDW
jgi:peroxiredoxin